MCPAQARIPVSFKCNFFEVATATIELDCKMASGPVGLVQIFLRCSHYVRALSRHLSRLAPPYNFCVCYMLLIAG